MLAKEMAPLLGRTIVVDNKAGAGSGLGASFVARAPADGNTLLLATLRSLAGAPAPLPGLVGAPLGVFAAGLGLVIGSLKGFAVSQRAR